MTKVMIFGTFDHLHEGHRFLVKQAKSRGTVVAVVARDATVTVIKGRVPRQSLAIRMAALRTAFPDISVIMGADDDYMIPIRSEKPDLLLFGYDQRLPPNVSLEDLPCPWERAEALKPEIYKSSLMSPDQNSVEKSGEK